MNKFSTKHRDRSMLSTVSYRNVPMFRGLAFALYAIEKNGGPVSVFSADRRDKVIREHNFEFGTSLKSQARLIQLYQQGKGNPANSVDTTSHCLKADATTSRLLRLNGPGSDLPWYALGLDIADRGKFEDVSTFLRVARKIGFKVTQPYPVGGEKHHVIFTATPIPVLEARDIISKNRTK